MELITSHLHSVDVALKHLQVQKGVAGYLTGLMPTRSVAKPRRDHFDRKLRSKAACRMQRCQPIYRPTPLAPNKGVKCNPHSAGLRPSWSASSQIAILGVAGRAKLRN